LKEEKELFFYRKEKVPGPEKGLLKPG